MSAARQARRERREAERKAKKAETRRIKAEQIAELPLEEEFPPELIGEANAVRARFHQGAGFVPQSAAPSKRAPINRANAQHSTGPISPSGRVDEAAFLSEPKTQARCSSRNSLKHGLASGTLLIPGEDASAFDALLHDLLEEHQPASTTEDLLVHEMAQSFWLAQRAIRLQSDCFTHRVNEKRLGLYLRYQTTHDRAFHRALNTLIRLKKDRAKLSSGFVSQNTAAESPERGFVSQNESADPHIGFVSQKRAEPALLSQPKPQTNGFVSQNSAPNHSKSVAESRADAA